MGIRKERSRHLRKLRKAESDETKLCPACEKILPFDAFSKESRNRKGFATQCRGCVQTKRFEKESIDPETANRIRGQVEARGEETEDTKACSTCLRVLSLASFCKAKSSRKGRNSVCRKCAKERKERNKYQNRSRMLQRKYGITSEQYEEMLEGQQGRCKICLTRDTGRHPHFEVDHHHGSGKVRGLLCHRCNKAIGLIDDNKATLLSAVKYLEESR
jgi:hypothetical protein